MSRACCMRCVCMCVSAFLFVSENSNKVSVTDNRIWCVSSKRLLPWQQSKHHTEVVCTKHRIFTDSNIRPPCWCVCVWVHGTCACMTLHWEKGRTSARSHTFTHQHVIDGSFLLHLRCFKSTFPDNRPSWIIGGFLLNYSVKNFREVFVLKVHTLIISMYL